MNLLCQKACFQNPFVVCIVRISDRYLSRKEPVPGVSPGENGRPIQNGLLLSVGLTEEVLCLTKLLSKSKWKHLFQLLVTFFVILTRKRSPVLLKLWPLHPPRSFLTFLFFSFSAFKSNSQLLRLAFVSIESMPIGTSRRRPFETILVHLILSVRQNESLAVHLASRKVQIVFHPEITNCFAT